MEGAGAQGEGLCSALQRSNPALGRPAAVPRAQLLAGARCDGLARRNECRAPRPAAPPLTLGRRLLGSLGRCHCDCCGAAEGGEGRRECGEAPASGPACGARPSMTAGPELTMLLLAFVPRCLASPSRLHSPPGRQRGQRAAPERRRAAAPAAAAPPPHKTCLANAPPSLPPLGHASRLIGRWVGAVPGLPQVATTCNRRQAGGHLRAGRKAQALQHAAGRRESAAAHPCMTSGRPWRMPGRFASSWPPLQRHCSARQASNQTGQCTTCPLSSVSNTLNVFPQECLKSTRGALQVLLTGQGTAASCQCACKLGGVAQKGGGRKQAASKNG